MRRASVALKTDGRSTRPKCFSQSERDATISRRNIIDSLSIEQIADCRSVSPQLNSHVQASLARSSSGVLSTSEINFSASYDQSRTQRRITFSIPSPYAQRIAVPISIQACLFSAPCTSSRPSCRALSGSRGRFSANNKRASIIPTDGAAPKHCTSDIQPCRIRKYAVS